MIIDASGHDSVAVKRLVDRNMVEWKGMNPMWVESGEEHVVEKTGEVYPGLVVAGMSVTETHGLARMGPTFGSMLYSGKKAAEVLEVQRRELLRRGVPAHRLEVAPQEGMQAASPPSQARQSAQGKADSRAHYGAHRNLVCFLLGVIHCGASRARVHAPKGVGEATRQGWRQPQAGRARAVAMRARLAAL